MIEKGGLKDTPMRKDLWSRALSRSDRHMDRDPERDTRVPKRQERKARSGERK